MICKWTYVINLKIYTWPLGRATKKNPRISSDVFHLNYMYMYLQIWFYKINMLCFSQILEIFNHIPVLFLWNKIIFYCYILLSLLPFWFSMSTLAPVTSLYAYCTHVVCALAKNFPFQIIRKTLFKSFLYEVQKVEWLLFFLV